MLVMPIVNRNRILNVNVRLKDAVKVRSRVKFHDTSECDIIVNGNRFSESTFWREKGNIHALNFIRNYSLRNKKNFLVTTRLESSVDGYDVYELEQPPKKINDGLDNLYASVVTDIRKELPGKDRGRYLSLEKLGVGDHLDTERISSLKSIVETSRGGDISSLAKSAQVDDLVETLSFIRCFDWTVIDDTSVTEESLQAMIEQLKKLNTRESRNLISYYNMALSNRDIYAKLAYLNKVVYGEPLTLIQSNRQREKRLVKTSMMGDEINGRAA